MNETFTKGQIDRLGNKIREESVQMTDETLLDLQKYRISHKEPLSHIFTILCILAKNIHHSSIATFRIKRFESIIGKLERYTDMRFSRMWDIGGCRCILRNEVDLYKIKNSIENTNELEILKVNDYMKEPQESGYKSIHIYLKHSCSDTVIELQLRTLIDHDWATLVEITDLLFDTRLKEMGDNKELFQMHKLLSNRDALNNEQKLEIFKTIKNYDFFEKLSEVFARNYLRVRKQWLMMETRNNHKYFLIETRKDDVPKIISFGTFTEAEENYFNVYKTTENANIVLTYVQSHNYNLIAIAYANYILTFHSFMNDCLELFESLIIESLIQKKYIKFNNLYNFWSELAYTHSKNLVSEIDEVIDNSILQNDKKSRSKFKRKFDDWLKDIKNQVEISNQHKRRLSIGLKKNLPAKNPSRFIGKLIIKRINKNTNNKLKKIFEKSSVFSAVIQARGLK